MSSVENGGDDGSENGNVMEMTSQHKPFYRCFDVTDEIDSYRMCY